MRCIARWSLLLLLGCQAHSPSGAMNEEPERYQIRIDGEFGSVTAGKTGEVLQPSATIALELRVRMVPTRRFSDGSYGRLLYLERAKITRTDGPDEQVIDNQLAGRTVELRTFPDGEILDISWGGKVVGQGRYLDVFDVIFPAVSPSAPSLLDGEATRRNMIWPVRQSKMFRWDNMVEALWQNEGQVEVDGTSAWSLLYQGEWVTKGITRDAQPRRQWSAVGQSTGTIRYDTEGANMLEHRLDWTRTVSVRGEGGIVSQEQRFVGTVERF